MRNGGGPRVVSVPRWRGQWVLAGAACLATLGAVVGGSLVASATKTSKSSSGASLSPVGLAGHAISMSATGITGAGSTGGPGGIEVNSFQWGLKGTYSCANCGLGARRTAMKPLVITRQIDSASPAFLQDCAQGRVISSVVLYVTPTGAGSQDTLALNFKDAIITDDDWNVGASTDPTESITMTYRNYRVAYTAVPFVLPTTTSSTSTTTSTTTTAPTITTVPPSTTTTSPTSALG